MHNTSTSTYALPDGRAEVAAPDDPDPHGHLLEHNRGHRTKRDPPQQYVPKLSPGKRGRRNGPGSDKRGCYEWTWGETHGVK